MRYEFSRKPRKCPACKATRIASILYGYPNMDSKLEADLEEKRIVLGGCVIADDDPKWQCTACEVVFYRKLDLDFSIPDS